MRLPTFGLTVLWASILGLVIPLIVMGAFWLHILRMAGAWLLYVWPSSIMLMATENMGHSAEAFGILAMSIGINVAVYALAFSFLWCLAWVVRAWRFSLRD